MNDDDAPPDDDVFARLRALEERQNALQIAWTTLATALVRIAADPNARDRLIGTLRHLAEEMRAKRESQGAALLETLATLLTRH